MDADRSRGSRPQFRFNALVVAGLASFLVGTAWLMLSLGLPSAGGAPGLDRTLGSAIRLAQSGILWGDIQLDDAQIRFNALVVGVFLDGLSPQQRATVSAVTDPIVGLLGNLFSPLGLLTLVVLLAAYFGIGRAIDVHYPDLLD